MTPTRLQRLARLLVDGARILTRRQADQLAAWIRRGRRDDLTGLAAVLGCILRALSAALGFYLLWRLIRACPNLLWLLTPTWCWAAIRTARRTTAEQAPEHAPEEPLPDPRDAVLRLLYEALGDRPAMYLSEVLQHLQERGQLKGWKVADLRARLEALGIPVEMRLKTGGRGASRGVVRAQLPPLPDGPETQASTAPSTAA
ncbi:hypothetical protein ACFVDT_07020 [Streptomyces sp. NPDC057699]|uniref:hypothetical protein n=1 Tax=Streptomyces sp. NPDC057699 TaxID=3346220 RepID=UPI0036760B04